MAYDLDMINGEYVFVYLDIFRLMRLEMCFFFSLGIIFVSSMKDMSLISWYKNESNELENNKARRAFETVLILAVKEPDTERYRQFSYQVNALQEGINHDNRSMGKLVCLMSINNLNLLHFYLLINKGQSICSNIL